RQPLSSRHLSTYYTTYLLSLLITPFFFFTDTATTEIYTLSLHDALPISVRRSSPPRRGNGLLADPRTAGVPPDRPRLAQGQHPRSEEHTSELQSRSDLVCRLLLEKKKKKISKSRYTATHTIAD